MGGLGEWECVRWEWWWVGVSEWCLMRLTRPQEGRFISWSIQLPDLESVPLMFAQIEAVTVPEAWMHVSVSRAETHACDSRCAPAVEISDPFGAHGSRAARHVTPPRPQRHKARPALQFLKHARRDALVHDTRAALELSVSGV